MAVNPKVARLSAQQRAALNRTVNGVTRTLTAAWAQAWDQVASEWAAALFELASAGENGQWPSRSQVTRAERAQRALEATQKLLNDLAAEGAATISGKLPDLTTASADWQARLVGAQMPAVAGADVVAGVAFNRVDPLALESIVVRTTQQITALSFAISPEATAAIQMELIRGMAVGDNPRTAARRMVKRVEGRFNGGLARANNIARTEMLDAHRAAAHAQDLTNADVLTGWEWSTKLDSRTCISCVVQHGSTHEIDEPGPLDHQQGRCARIPVTKSWRELGYDIDEPAGIRVDAKKWFDGLPGEEQVAMMGKERLKAYQSGEATWDDLSTRRRTSGWRDSFVPTPVANLRRTTP